MVLSGLQGVTKKGNKAKDLQTVVPCVLPLTRGHGVDTRVSGTYGDNMCVGVLG